MTEDQLAIIAALKSARYYAEPYPHAIIDNLAPSGLFSYLARTWPSAALYPVPAEQTSVNPSRLHAWLNDRTRISTVNAAWSEIAWLCHSEAFRNELVQMLKNMGLPFHYNISCISRICEERLPYELKRHRDSSEKLLSLIWYIDGGPDSNLGTKLYGSKHSKLIESIDNSVLCIPNIQYSFHGGEWATPASYNRRTLQVFAIKSLARDR